MGEDKKKDKEREEILLQFIIVMITSCQKCSVGSKFLTSLLVGDE